MIYALAALILAVLGFAVWIYSRGSSVGKATAEVKAAAKAEEDRDDARQDILETRDRMRGAALRGWLHKRNGPDVPGSD